MKLVSLSLLAASLYAASGDGTGNPTAVDLSSLTIEQLMDVNATAILKGAGNPSQAAAAIYIITAEDIRRSGLTSIPELLRLVPGMEVARESATTWSISARGFTNQVADKMLVLIDGRRVYDPLLGGVFWDAQDLPLYDIAQIEVIRGPGSSLWGSDAVNGVINIITKSARETQGLRLEADAGTIDGVAASAQYGGKIGARTYFRVFGKYNGQSLLAPDGSPVGAAEPDISTGRGGFRIDSDPTVRDTLTVQGDIYSGTVGKYFLEETRSTSPRDGADVLTRWTHRMINGSETTLQIYWDKTDRSVYDSSYHRNTFDVDFQHQFKVAEHNVTWGIRANYALDGATDSPVSGLNPNRLGFKIFDGFLQDEIPLACDRFQFTVGSKFEYNDYSGFEWQPNIRFAFTPDERHTLWTAVSRGVVVPSVWNRSGYLSLSSTATQLLGEPAVELFTGNPHEASQDLVAYEAGYRTQVRPNLSFDLATFFNVYSHLATLETGIPYLGDAPDFNVVIPITMGNNMRGTGYGVELSASWKPTERWKISGSYSLLEMHLHLLNGSDAITSLDDQGQSPRNVAQIHSYLDLHHGFELDAALYFSGVRPTWQIAPYTQFDIRGGWRVGEHAEFSVVGQNLLAGSHLEAMSQSDLPPTSIHRSVYGRIQWCF